MFEMWERYKLLQLINSLNTDYAMFIWKSKRVLLFSKQLSRYQNSEILLSLKITALSNSYYYVF